MPAHIPLPIDALLPEIMVSLRSNRSLVIEAPAGAGKTTRVPPALLEFGGVLVLEPRRIAARMSARRVAQEMDEVPGHTVGYQVRFEDVSSKHTRLRFVTEGVLTRRLLHDPELRGVQTVVLDEFHERHLDGDTGLALLGRLQNHSRPDLRIVVMSATLDGSAVSQYLGGCPRLRSEGRLHPLSMEYRPHSNEPLEQQVAAAVRYLVETGLDGDVLVFLPGASEIRRAARACEGLAQRAGLLICPLHGDLPPGEQDRAVEASPQRKLIISTNVAESSLTIEGVTAVIDSGLARIPRDSPFTGLPSLEVERVSQAAATQRAGRAGRVRPGRVIRLYPEEDFLRRRGREVPEIQRRELSGLVLSLRAMGAGSLEWLDAPPAEAYQAAENLLLRLGATSSGGSITARGRAMAKLPLHPRLAALVCEAERRGAGREGCEAAALLSAGDRLPAGLARHRGQSDVLALMEQTPSQEARRLRDLLLRQVKPGAPQANPDAILISILSAFPDRLVYRRGGIPELFESSVVGGHPLLVAIDIEQRRERGTLVRLASAVQPEWLIDLFPERVEERVGLQWNRAAERVEASSALLYDGLVIEESTGGSIDPGEAAKILAHQAVEAGVERFTDPEELRALAARTEFAAMHGGPPALDNTRIEQALTGLCYGLRSFAELRGAAGDSLLSSLLDSYSPAERRLLEEIAPERYRLPRGRTSRIHYEAVKPPWLATRMQDFFGMKESPRVARGQVALVLHLLAPNQRSVQTTTDLASFWQHLYPELRRQLSRRYPKHQWPENPMD